MFQNILKNGKNILTREHSNILSAATIIMVTSALSALLGVLRNRLLISFFYTKPEILDVYWAAFRIPDMVFQLLIVGALSAAFIPVFSNLLSKNEKQANYIASSTINIVLIFLVVLSAIIMIFAYPLSSLITHNFTDQQLTLMASLTRIMAIAQIFFGISSFLTGIIQSHKRFLVPAISPLLYNIGIILGILFLSKYIGIYGPALGVILGSILHLSAQIPLTKELGFKYTKTIDINNESVRKIGKLMLPRTLALSVAQIEQTAIVFFATALTKGSLTMIYIAQQLSNVPVRMFGIPIGQASLPFFTKEYARKKLNKIISMLSESLMEIIYLTMPASVLILILRIPLVRLAYGAHSFPWKATVLTGRLVAILSLAIASRSIIHLIIRVFYALHNTKTPLFIALTSTLINIVMSYYLIFVVHAGIISLAVSITTTSFIEMSLLTVFLFKALGTFPSSEFMKSLTKITFATAIMAVSLWIPFRLLDKLIFDTTRTIPLVLLTITTSIIGLIIYISLSYILHIKQLKIFTKLIRRIGNWRSVLSKSEESIETTVRMEDN